MDVTFETGKVFDIRGMFILNYKIFLNSLQKLYPAFTYEIYLFYFILFFICKRRKTIMEPKRKLPY